MEGVTTFDGRHTMNIQEIINTLLEKCSLSITRNDEGYRIDIRGLIAFLAVIAFLYLLPSLVGQLAPLIE
jgi:hypothetical protein